MRVRVLICAASCVAALASFAQTPSDSGFPADAQPLKAQALFEHVNAKVFNVAVASGASWRLQFQSGGAFYINVSTGFADSGRWRTEDSMLCTEPVKGKASCNEVRIAGGVLLMKRDNGDVVKLEPR